MVSNIVIANLTDPEPTVKGTSAPIISTKVGQRDGTRSGGGGGGGGGTTGLYDITNFSYLGAFILSDPGGEGKISFGYGAIAYNPPEPGGRNGPLGSVFVSGRTKDGSPHPSDDANVAEWQIPETLETSLSVTTADTLPEAVALQPFIRTELTSAGSDGVNTLTDFSNNMVGFMCVADGKLFCYYTSGYEQGYGTETTPRLNTLSVFTNPADLSQGGIAFGNLSAHKATAHSWMVPIPSDKQAALGGTHLFGSGGSRASFDTVSSWGPSLHVGSPEGYAGGELAVTPKLNYPSNLSVAGSIPRPADWKGVDQPNFDAYNQTALIHYLSFFGPTDATAYLTPPAGNPCFQALKDWLETPEPKTQWNTLPPPPGPLNDLWLLAFSTAACGFIIPNTNTYLVIGTMGGAKYGGGYKFPQWGGSFTESAGPATVDPDDVQPTFYWAYNLDDILSADNVHDPFPYAYGEVPNKPPRWIRPIGSNQEPAPLCGGTIDLVNRRYYQTRFEVKKGTFGKVNVIEVYSF